MFPATRLQSALPRLVINTVPLLPGRRAGGALNRFVPNLKFLPSVVKYNVKTGVLALQHAYPPPPHPAAVALVDVTLLLATLTVTDTQVGEWVNVIGYVATAGDASSAGGGRGARGRVEGGSGFVRMQAIVLWSAGSVKIGEYERVLTERQRVESDHHNM